MEGGSSTGGGNVLWKKFPCIWCGGGYLVGSLELGGYFKTQVSAGIPLGFGMPMLSAGLQIDLCI